MNRCLHTPVFSFYYVINFFKLFSFPKFSRLIAHKRLAKLVFEFINSNKKFGERGENSEKLL